MQVYERLEKKTEIEVYLFGTNWPHIRFRQRTYEDKVCYHDYECRNFTAEAELEKLRNIYVNMTSDVNSTLIAELKIYECCDANATYATGDYSSGYDDEDYEDDVRFETLLRYFLKAFE